jgi:predicted TIM-barrel fold metal-dependent hydrolase
MVLAAMLPAQIKLGATTSQPLDSARSGEPINNLEVIDTHGHIDETLPDAVWPRNVDLLIKDMDRCGTRQIVVSHFGALAATTDESLKQAHDHCVQAAHRFPGRLRAYIVVQPYLEASKVEMDRILAPNSIFSGMKLHGALHQYPADGPAYQAAYKFASDHSLPLLFHVGPGLERVGTMAGRYPGMKLILAHYGGGSAAVLKWVRDMPNLFVDACTSNGPRHIVERLLDACGSEKILYGSDSAYLCMGSQIARIAFARISDEEKRRIYGLNARAIFNNRLAPPA